MIKYIENKNMQIADKRFCEFDKEYKYGNPSMPTHIMITHSIFAHMEGTV